MLGQLLGIAPSAVDSTLSVVDYALLKHEYHEQRLLPQRLEQQVAYIAFMIASLFASLFGNRTVQPDEFQNYVLFAERKPRERMSTPAILGAASTIGKKRPPKKFTAEEIAQIEEIEKRMIAAGL